MPETSTTLFFATLGAVVLGARYYFRNYSSANTAVMGDEAAPAAAAAAGGAGAGAGAGASGHSAANNGAPPRPREVTDDMVSVVQVLVPKISAAEIRRDLEQTRSVEVTTERLLARSKKGTLFDRYGVDMSKKEEDASAANPDEDLGADWVNVREKREEKLRKQREQMLLKARQRSLELSGNLH